MAEPSHYSRSSHTLETHAEEADDWAEGDQEYDPYDAYAYDDGRNEEYALPAQGSSYSNTTMLDVPAGYSRSPSIRSGDSNEMTNLPTPDFSGPPPEYENTLPLDFNRFRISDPNPRSSSPASLQPDESRGYAHSSISHSLDGESMQRNQGRSTTLPISELQTNRGGPPPRSASISHAPGIAVYDELVVGDRTSPDAVSVYSNGSGRSGQSGYLPQTMQPYPAPFPPSGGYPPSQYYGHTSPPAWQPPPNQFTAPYSQVPPPTIPPPAQYDPIYAAASDLLGPPPGAQAPAMPALNGTPYAVPPGPQTLAPYQQPGGLYRGPSTASSMRSGYTGNSVVTGYSGGNGSSASLARSGTTASSITTLNTRKTKAVDANQPPFTKEYIDQYRARLKADPDPEAHFAYGKYLIEAAKKFGAHSADQKAVRRYRDALISEALKVIRKLATQGDPYPEAQFYLANCYGTGMLGLQIDHEKAYHLYLQAGKQNHPASSYRVAVCNELGAGTRRDHARAFAFYRKAASLGDTPAMYKLGMVLLTGQLGQQKDEREAITWLKRAAEQADEENPHALHELGLLHESTESKVVIHDEAYAKELFTKAANLGYAKSCLKLGSCYEYGTLTCPVDPKRSIAWYTRAAEKADPEAELALSGWYLTGSEGVLQQSDREAYLWARRAANKGLPKAEYAVGYYAEVGIGIKSDIEFARRWYLRAAAQGHARSKERLTQLKIQSNKRLARPTRQQAKDECVIM